MTCERDRDRVPSIESNDGSRSNVGMDFVRPLAAPSEQINVGIRAA